MSNLAPMSLYLKAVRKHKIGSEAILSGLTCIIFFSSLPLSKSRSLSDVRRLVNYILLYLLVDYQLDDPNVADEEKRDLLLSLLEGRDSVPKDLRVMYNNLVRSPNEAQIFSQVTLTTAQSFLVQYSSSSTLSDLFNICVNKGGQTVLVGYRLIYREKCAVDITDDQLLLLGACIQLLDDIIDCSKDRREGIETIATCSLTIYQHLDHLASVLLLLAFELNSHLHLQRDTIVQLAKRAVDRSSHFSSSFREQLGLARYKRRGVS